MVELKSDDYAIIQYGSKKLLCLVLNAKSRRAVIESSLSTDDPKNIEYENENIVANLGPNPIPGTAFGCNIAPYQRTIETDAFGPIHIYRDMESKELKCLKKAMKTARKLYSTQASIDFLPLKEIRILPKKGKYAGLYKTKVVKGEVADSMHLFPETFEDEEWNVYMLCHEFAHGLWARCVPPKIRAKWVKLYHKRLQLADVTETQLDDIFNELMDFEHSVSEFGKELEDENIKLIMKEVLGYFKRNYRMSVREVDILLQFDSGALKKLWPTTACLLQERPDISEYSLKNVDEFFAEAVAYHLTEKMVPKDVRKGIENTFKYLGKS